jgi:hypothetical protein
MEFILYLLFLTISIVLFSLIRYYVLLFKEVNREQFDRSELIDFTKLIPKSLLDTFEQNKNLTLALAVYSGITLFTFLYCMLGGLIGSPHYTNEIGNYFFYSPFLTACVAFGYPFLLDALYPDKEYYTPNDLLGKILFQENSILLGFGLGTISANLAVYGAYHQLPFPLIFFNSVLTLAILIYKIKPSDKVEETEYEYSDDHGEYISDPDWENDQRYT